MLRLASYTGTRRGLKGAFNVACRWWLHSQYSHTELVFSDGASFSCALTDGKHPRFKAIEFDPGKWHFFDLPNHDEQAARARAEQIASDPNVHYSITLLAAFVIQPLFGRVSPSDHVCSSVCAAALGLPEPQRQSPQSLPVYLSR